MSGPVIDPDIPRLQQTTSTASRAAGILRTVFPSHFLNSQGSGHQHNIAVQLPRKLTPTYILPNNNPQPWELLPMKVAATKQYPNFFNNCCTFFGSINRDVVNKMPICLIRPSKVGIDLAKIVRNLGIVAAFELYQKRSKLSMDDYVWPPGKEPEDVWDVKPYKEKYIKLHLRWDQHRPLWSSPDSSAALGPASTADPVPSAAKNLSKASQPVLMYPEQLARKRATLPAGIFILYHPELGLITDAQAEQYDVAGLVMAHLALPYSMVTQIRGALRQKFMAEQGVPLRHVMRLQDWSLVDFVRDSLTQRQAQLAQQDVEGQVRQIQHDVKQSTNKMRTDAIRYGKLSSQLRDELLAWELTRNPAWRDHVPDYLLASGSSSGRGAPGDRSLFGGRSARQTDSPGAQTRPFAAAAQSPPDIGQASGSSGGYRRGDDWEPGGGQQPEGPSFGRSSSHSDSRHPPSSGRLEGGRQHGSHPCGLQRGGEGNGRRGDGGREGDQSQHESRSGR